MDNGTKITNNQKLTDRDNGQVDAVVIRQTKVINITGWTSKKKFYCPDCGSLLIKNGSKYGCNTCGIDYKLKMGFGV